MLQVGQAQKKRRLSTKRGNIAKAQGDATGKGKAICTAHERGPTKKKITRKADNQPKSKIKPIPEQRGHGPEKKNWGQTWVGSKATNHPRESRKRD